MSRYTDGFQTSVERVQHESLAALRDLTKELALELFLLKKENAQLKEELRAKNYGVNFITNPLKEILENGRSIQKG